MNKIKTYKMPAEYTSCYGLGVRCGGYRYLTQKLGFVLEVIYFVGMIKFIEDDYNDAPAYVIRYKKEHTNSIEEVFLLSDEYYIYGVHRPFKTIDQAIKHLKSICV